MEEMERWVLEGDSYSFFRSAPHTFNLQSREGPNRVEIFDITSIPSNRNAISETTCLCDIFGDDGESPSLSSSPASATFVRREVDQPSPGDDANDSSGSYHTANGSDLSDNTAVTYNTPSPKNIQDFSSLETRESHSLPTESTILPDSKNGLNAHDCAPPAPKVNGNDLSHTDNWEDPQVTVSIAPVNETEITNAYEPQDMISTPATSPINSAKETSNPTSCSSEEEQPADFEQEGSITTPHHTSSTSPFLDKQVCIPIFESTDSSVSSESKESMNFYNSQEENTLSTLGAINSGSTSQLSNASPTDCSPVQEISISPANQEITFMPEHRFTPISPVSREISCRPAYTGRASPDLLNLCSPQVKNTSESPDTFTLPASDNREIDSLTASAISAETREMLYSSIDGRERLESPGINETCFSHDNPASAHSTEPVMIHSPVGYTISPSPTNERIVSSTEPEALPSSPVGTMIDGSYICSSPDRSEPVIIQSSQDYTISPSPTNERGVYSTEPEGSISSHCCHSENSSSFDHSVPAQSPEPAIINSLIGTPISPSPTNERRIYSTEPDDLLSTPSITATPTCSRDSTPALRSIASTPNSRENYLTPEPSFQSPSPELRSVTYSPEIKTISYSILPQYTKSPMIGGISPNKDLAQSPVADKVVCSNYAEISNSYLENDSSVSPRPSSTASEHIRDTAPTPEPSKPLEKAENQPLPIICEEMNLPSQSPVRSDYFDKLADKDTVKSSASVPDEFTSCGSEVVSQIQILRDSPSSFSSSELSAVQMEKNQEIVTDNTTALTVCETPSSPSPWALSVPGSVASVKKKQSHIEIYDHNEGTEMLENYSPSSDKRLCQVPVQLGEGVISGDNAGKFDREPCRKKEESGKREGKGEETVGDSSYRGEQVELSFNARNRKGPASRSPALSSRDPKSGIPARCYFESPPATYQQQSQLRAQSSQQENKGGAKRLQSSTQGKYSSPGFLLPEYTGETSSMGSEFDEADNEVKWFTDLAFRSLSSPQVDYLDVYNSSHRSSTNVSQPSTVDSPGAVAWMTYADLRGSALHENDGSSFLPRDGLDPSKHFEMGSFECVDVALESKEESSKGKRTVPKRQIQLLRRSTDESKHKGNTENVSNSPSTNRRLALFRQHSTPAFVQEEIFKELPDSPQNDRKRTLQKSQSLDDGSPKTQMASCIIKSVLSKKMQDAQKETPKTTNPSPSGDKNKLNEISPSTINNIPSNTEKHSLTSNQNSECSLSSEEFAIREERSRHLKCAPKVPPKPFLRPAFFNTEGAMMADSITREETKPIVALPPVNDKIPVKQNSKSDRKGGGRGKLGKKYNSDSANASVRNTSAAVATPAISMQSTTTSRDTKHQMTPENQEQLAGKSVFMSKTPEITLKPSSIKGKKSSSLKVSLSPDLEQSREISEPQAVENAAEDTSNKCSKVTETEVDDNNKTKSVMHRVRDVRKLVKNMYNLSFKASNSTSNADDMVIQEKREKPPQTPPALQIECKAISWKDKQTSGSKAIHCPGEKQPVDISKISQPWVGAETRRDADITEISSKASSLETEPRQKLPDSHSATIEGFPESESISERPYISYDQSAKIPPRTPSKEREVSALMVLPDGLSKTKTFDPTIPDPTHMKGTNSSHSVSMLLKEKGMQADIGVCDVPTECATSKAKHINRLEIPVQACLSEGISSEPQVRAEGTALPCNPTAPVNCSSRTSKQSESPKVTLMEESSTKELEKKKITSTTTMTQIPTFLASPGKPEMRSVSSNTKNTATPVNASKEIELPIQVRSISNDRVKPVVPPKPSYKQSFAEIKSVSSDPPKADKHASSVVKQQTRLSTETKKNETPTTVIHKEQLNEPSSRDTKRLAVSAISSYKPPPNPVTTTSNTAQKSTTMAFASLDQQQSSGSLQTTSSCQQQTPSSQDQAMLDTSFASNPSGPQALSQTQSVTRASSNNCFHTDEYLFYASDDPPSYDERESFSPLRLSDLPPQKSCRYHPTTKQSPCSCPPNSLSHQGHAHHSPLERVPGASRSPGQVLTCPGALPQAQVRPHQCRPDGLPVSNTTIPQASAMIQPLHNPRACPVSSSQSYGDDQPPTSGLHADRCPGNHPSPQAVAPASYHDYSHSANMPTLDPRPQLFNPQDLPSSFGHDYANEGPGGAGVLYQENASGLSCGQGPRRVLLDPETGKYFYIEVPMQPLRKMLFDPELGQYVEVLIPQQAMSHSGLYPPAAPPYSSLHSPGLYAPQYLPYAVPSYPAIPGGAQQVHHPEPPPVPATLHQSSLRYGSPGGQMPKNEPKGHTSLDQSYLESMYYIPTGMNASPNSNPSDCYHKPSSSMPPSGGRRA